MKLDHLDLNLLLAFDVLASERSVTRAAARVGVSQPAMSGSLARLRAMFGDPLFVRADGHMAPTPRARQLAGPIGEALGRLRLAVEPAAAFQPGAAEREFVIAATDYAETALLGRLVSAVRAVGSRIVLRTIRPQHAFAPPIAELRDGSADLSLGLTHEMPGPRSELRTAFLGRERMVGVLRAGHRHAGRRLALREFARLREAFLLYR